MSNAELCKYTVKLNVLSESKFEVFESDPSLCSCWLSNTLLKLLMFVQTENDKKYEFWTHCNINYWFFSQNLWDFGATFSLESISKTVSLSTELETPQIEILGDLLSCASIPVKYKSLKMSSKIGSANITSAHVP